MTGWGLRGQQRAGVWEGQGRLPAARGAPAVPSPLGEGLDLCHPVKPLPARPQAPPRPQCDQVVSWEPSLRPAFGCPQVTKKHSSLPLTQAALRVLAQKASEAPSPARTLSKAAVSRGAAEERPPPRWARHRRATGASVGPGWGRCCGNPFSCLNLPSLPPPNQVGNAPARAQAATTPRKSKVPATSQANTAPSGHSKASAPGTSGDSEDSSSGDEGNQGPALGKPLGRPQFLLPGVQVPESDPFCAV